MFLKTDLMRLSCLPAHEFLLPFCSENFSWILRPSLFLNAQFLCLVHFITESSFLPTPSLHSHCYLFSLGRASSSLEYLRVSCLWNLINFTRQSQSNHLTCNLPGQNHHGPSQLSKNIKAFPDIASSSLPRLFFNPLWLVPHSSSKRVLALTLPSCTPRYTYRRYGYFHSTCSFSYQHSTYPSSPILAMNFLGFFFFLQPPEQHLFSVCFLFHFCFCYYLPLFPPWI